MNRVTRRTWMVGVFMLLLMAGVFMFLWDYVSHAQDWVMFSGSPHIYNNGNLGCGVVTDRSGNILLDLSTGRTYSADATTRKSTLHWLGDRQGYIRAAAVSAYASALAGWDPINGVYNYSGTGGTEVLTLSARVQNAALSALYGRKGTVAVYNYRTGEILCAVTSPTYDPDHVPDISGDTTGTYTGVYLNRFLQSSYAPGSIFKIVTTAAALDSVPGIESRTFTCYGSYEYGKEAVTCETAHGTMDLKGALANSCNCAFAQIAELVGKKSMVSHVAQYGITEKVSFDGVTTAAGNYDISDTGSASFAWSCIGQHSDLINACRWLQFMGQIAGGGQAAEPHIVALVTDGEGKVSYLADTRNTERIMSTELAGKLQEYMRNNVEVKYGSWHFPGLTVCAKSGTAQLGGNQEPNAMFSGYVLDAAYPLAFICIVENGGYGATTCIPIISSVLSECVTVMDYR